MIKFPDTSDTLRFDPLEDLKLRSDSGTHNENENTLGFPQREKSGIIRRRSGTKVLAPFCSLNILFLRRGPSQAPLAHILSIDSHMHTYEKTRREGERRIVPIPEFLSIDRSGDAPSPPRVCTRDANFSICKSCIGRYANARNMCAPSFSNPFPPSTPKMIGNAPDICISWIFPLIVYRDHCTVGSGMGRWFLRIHDGSKPLIRISHWIEPVLGLTDCLECSQDPVVSGFLMFFTAESVCSQMFLRIN